MEDELAAQNVDCMRSRKAIKIIKDALVSAYREHDRLQHPATQHNETQCQTMGCNTIKCSTILGIAV